MTFSDHELARRLESTEAHSNAAFVEARARLFAGCGAEWRTVAGAFVLFDGPNSPLTQTFGLGLFEEASADDLAEMEAFLRPATLRCYTKLVRWPARHCGRCWASAATGP